MDGISERVIQPPRKKNIALADEIRRLALRIAALEASRQQAVSKPARPVIKRNQKAENWIADSIDETFSEQELSELAYELGIDYEALLGEGKRGKVRAFVSHCGRRGYIEILINALAQERPHIDWHKALINTNELKNE